MATFKKDPVGLARLRHEADISEYAKAIEREAKLIAPVGDRANDPHPGMYRDGIEARPGMGRTWIVVGKAFYSWMLEFGTVDTPVFATLRKASKVVADRVDENRKPIEKRLERLARLERDQG